MQYLAYLIQLMGLEYGEIADGADLSTLWNSSEAQTNYIYQQLGRFHISPSFSLLGEPEIRIYKLTCQLV